MNRKELVAAMAEIIEECGDSLPDPDGGVDRQVVAACAEEIADLIEEKLGPIEKLVVEEE